MNNASLGHRDLKYYIYVGSFSFFFFYILQILEISLSEALSFAGQSVSFFLLLVVLCFVFGVVLIDHFLRHFLQHSQRCKPSC